MFTAAATIISALIGAGVAIYTNWSNEKLYDDAAKEAKKLQAQQDARQKEVDEFNEWMGKEGISLQKQQLAFNKEMSQEQLGLQKAQFASEKDQQRFKNVVDMLNTNPQMRNTYTIWGK